MKNRKKMTNKKKTSRIFSYAGRILLAALLATVSLTAAYPKAEAALDCTHENYIEVTTNPTCTQDGKYQKICTNRRCHLGSKAEDRVFYEETIPRLGHKSVTEDVEPTCTEGGHRLKYCERCYKEFSRVDFDPLGHKWGKWEEITKPTCRKTGLQIQNCKNCDETKEQETAALGHDYVQKVVNPTCTEGGYKELSCSRCPLYSKQDFEPRGHEWGKWEEITKPTCTKTGLQIQNCKNCDETKEQETAALEHDYVQKVVRATCTEWGYKELSCSRCPLYSRQDIEEPHGHEWGKWIVTKEAACNIPGTVTSTCKLCNEWKTKSTNPLQHVFTSWEYNPAPTCTQEGKQFCYCTRCNNCTKWVTLPATGHKLNSAGFCKICNADSFVTECAGNYISVPKNTKIYSNRELSSLAGGLPVGTMVTVDRGNDKVVHITYSSNKGTLDVYANLGDFRKMAESATQGTLYYNEKNKITDITGTSLGSCYGVPYRVILVEGQSGSNLYFSLAETPLSESCAQLASEKHFITILTEIPLLFAGVMQNPLISIPATAISTVKGVYDQFKELGHIDENALIVYGAKSTALATAGKTIRFVFVKQGDVWYLVERKERVNAIVSVNAAIEEQTQDGEPVGSGDIVNCKCDFVAGEENLSWNLSSGELDTLIRRRESLYGNYFHNHFQEANHTIKEIKVKVGDDLFVIPTTNTWTKGYITQFGVRNFTDASCVEWFSEEGLYQCELLSKSNPSDDTQ